MVFQGSVTKFGVLFLLVVRHLANLTDAATIDKKGIRGLQETRDTQSIYDVVVDVGAPDPLLSSLNNISPNASEEGMWSPEQMWPIVSIHSVVLPDGRLLTYGSPANEGVQDGRTFIFWDSSLGFGSSSYTAIPNTQSVDSFCSSGTFLEDGTFLISGGGSGRAGTSFESTVLNWKNPVARRAANLVSPRWYGTMTKLPDGRALITGGAKPYVVVPFRDPEANADDVSSTPEVYDNALGEWASLTGAYSLDAFGAENNRYWYPRQWVTPYGTVFGVSTDKMWEMTLEGTGSIKTIGTFKTAANNAIRPNVGPTSTAVMYDTGKILQVGGNGYHNGYPSDSSNTATTFDISDINIGNVIVADTDPMTHPRQWANSLVLPNGRVLVSGGSRFADAAGQNSVLPVEIWDPVTGQWKIGASAGIYRGYHSSLALLPNGAIFSSGGGVPGPVNNFNAEIYYPPYLFTRQGQTSVLASRLKIISMSSNRLNYNDKLQVQVDASANVAEVSCIALPTVTHSFDSNQRRLQLSFQITADGLEIDMPANAALAPPGYFYISIVDGNGVPSKSAIIGLGDVEAPPLPGAEASSPIASIPEITGAFTAEFIARFDDVSGQYAYQRVFDFGLGAGLDNVLLGQCGNSQNLCFDVYKGRIKYTVAAVNAIVQGETATWKVGVDPNGSMWIEKDGTRLATAQGALPNNLRRIFKLLGQSNWAADAPLRGAILGLIVTNTGEARDESLLNTAAQIHGAFSVTVIARYDNIKGGYWQRVFDFGDSQRRNNIWLGQCGNTNDMCFEMLKDGTKYREVAPVAILEGELAKWEVSINEEGIMSISKNGNLLASRKRVVPNDVQRSVNLIGASNWPADDDLDGVVLGLSVISDKGTIDPTVSLGLSAIKEITGAFEAEVTARFDRILESNWKRIFDFGNGPMQDNVWLGQCAGSTDICFEIVKTGVKYRSRASNALIDNELAAWKVGVDTTGLMWIEKNGNRLVSTQHSPAAVPRNVQRAKLLGESNWAADAPLKGVVLDLVVTNAGEARDDVLVNKPQQINGPFTIDVSARFDNVAGGNWQRVFDFGNGPYMNNILFGQCGNTGDMCFDIWQSGSQSRVVATNSITEGELATWTVSVDEQGNMVIVKNNEKIAEGAGVVPANVNRANNLVGYSNWQSDDPLDGVILGLVVKQP